MGSLREGVLGGVYNPIIPNSAWGSLRFPKASLWVPVVRRQKVQTKKRLDEIARLEAKGPSSDGGLWQHGRWASKQHQRPS